MKKAKIETRGKDNPTLIQDLGTIVTKTATIPALAAKSTALGTALTNLTTAGNDKKIKEEEFHAAVEAERLARGTVDTAVTVMRTGIDDYAQGDEVKILSTGAKVAADASPAGQPAKVTGLYGGPGNMQNTIRLDWNTQPGVTFDIEDSDAGDPNGVWKHAGISTKSKATLAGYASGVRKWFRVAAVNATGHGPWSDPATGMAS